MSRTIHTLLIAIMAAAMTVAATGVSQSAERQPAPPVAKKAPPIYGSQLMTQQERNEYNARMRAAKTPEAREALRAEHHKAMQERARERGVTLPDQPRAGAGPGKGKGKGTGMGPGGGTGPRRDGSGPGPRPAQ